MEYKNRMEQHYAIFKSGELIHIREANMSNEDCFCPHCGCRMLKRCGNIRTWHFAHDYRYENEVHMECSYESYLHAFAKLRFKQWFDNTDSIILNYQQPTCKFANDCIWRNSEDKCSVKKSIDLKKCLSLCTLEETISVGNHRFRADLLWSNPEKPKNDILVEIKVTHECSQKKKESNKRIIEFEVHSEEDVENIVTNDISESETVRFYGFNPKNFIEKRVSAKHSLLKFIYYNSGKAFARSECNCKSFRKRLDCALLEITIRNYSNHSKNLSLSERQSTVVTETFSYGRLYNWGLALAKSRGYDVKNCYLCRHHHYDFEDERLSCKLNPNKPCNATDAIPCSKYVLDEDYYHKNLEEFEQFSQNNEVDVWSKI